MIAQVGDSNHELGKKKKNNRGTATTELAVCMPVLTLIIFSSIEACNLIHIKQVVAAAAYEGALVASKRGAEETAVQNRVEDLLDARDIKGLYDFDGNQRIRSCDSRIRPTI